MSDEEETEDSVLPEANEVLPYEDLLTRKRDDGLWHCPGCSRWFEDERALRAHARPKHLIRWKAQELTEKGKYLKSFRTYDDMDVTDLKPWHRIAVFQNYVLGHSYASIARALSKNEKTIRELCMSEAAERLAGDLHEMVSSNDKLLSVVIGASAAGVTMDDMMALQWAKEAEDYEFVHKFSMDYFKMAGIDRKGDGGGQSIIINLDTRSLEIPEVSVSHKIVVPDTEEADFEIVE